MRKFHRHVHMKLCSVLFCSFPMRSRLNSLNVRHNFCLFHIIIPDWLLLLFFIASHFSSNLKHFYLFFIWILCTQKWLNIVHSFSQAENEKIVWNLSHFECLILSSKFACRIYLWGQKCEYTEHRLIKLKYAWIVINFEITIWKIFSLLVLLCFCGYFGRCIDKNFGVFYG